MNDIEIVEKVIEGKVDLFEGIVMRYHLKVYNLCIGFVHQSEDAEDLTQEIFTKVYTSLHSFQGKSQFSTWLYRISLNTIYSELRCRKRKERILYCGRYISSGFNFASILPRNEEPDQILNEKQINQQIYYAINSLSTNQQTAFMLSKYEELSQREIAETMNLSEEAIESLLQRAKRNLQSKLKNFYYYELKPTEIVLAND